MQISAQGAMAAMYRQDVLTNNLANINTVAFKPDTPLVRQRDTAVEEDALFGLPTSAMLEALGAGATAFTSRTSFAQGSLRTTGNSLDLALEGEGFFRVQGESDAQPVLTRDGRFTIAGDGKLVMAVGGREVLTRTGRPIRLDPSSPVEIDAQGRISQNGQVVGDLAVVKIADKAALTKMGEGLFTGPTELLAGARPGSAAVRQFALEDSSVNEIEALMDITDAAGAAQRNLGMIAYQDRLMDRCINVLGRVSG